MKHYIKNLIHYNSLRLNLSISLGIDKSLNTETYQKYKKVVKKKIEILNTLNFSQDELREIKESDEGDKLEILLFYQKLQQLYINEAINILDINSYNKSIYEHLKDFLEKNKPCSEIHLDKIEIPVIKKLIQLVEKYSLNKRMVRTELDGNISIQIESSATQVSGSVFLEFKSDNVRGYYGTN